MALHIDTKGDGLQSGCTVLPAMKVFSGISKKYPKPSSGASDRRVPASTFFF